MNLPPIMYCGRFALLWHCVENAAAKGDLPYGGQAADKETDRETEPETEQGAAQKSHWDLLLEMDNGQLLTWRVDSLPRNLIRSDASHAGIGMWASCLGNDTFSTVATRLVDHRGIYLDYQGPILGNRGSVSRLDAGQYRAWLPWQPGCLFPAHDEPTKSKLVSQANATARPLESKRIDHSCGAAMAISLEGQNLLARMQLVLTTTGKSCTLHVTF